MDNASLNRAVALARGWTHIHNGQGKHPADFTASLLPDVCTSPVAWGAFYEELRADGWLIELSGNRHDCRCRLVHQTLIRQRQSGYAVASSPGRALAEAFLKATQTKEQTNV